MTDISGTTKGNPPGTTLRSLREMSGLSIRQLAELSNLHHGTLARIERDERSASLNVIVAVVTACRDHLAGQR